MPVVIETPDYLIDAIALGLTADERKLIVDTYKKGVKRYLASRK